MTAQEILYLLLAVPDIRPITGVAQLAISHCCQKTPVCVLILDVICLQANVAQILDGKIQSCNVSALRVE